jgi:hypothetical protein
MPRLSLGAGSPAAARVGNALCGSSAHRIEVVATVELLRKRAGATSGGRWVSIHRPTGSGIAAGELARRTPSTLDCRTNGLFGCRAASRTLAGSRSPTPTGSPVSRGSRRPPLLRQWTVSPRGPRVGGRQRPRSPPPSGGRSALGQAPRFARVSRRHGARACVPPALEQGQPRSRDGLRSRARSRRQHLCRARPRSGSRRRSHAARNRKLDALTNSAATRSVRRLDGVCRGPRILGVGHGSYSEAGPKLMRGRSARENIPAEQRTCGKTPSPSSRNGIGGVVNQ